MPNKWGNNRNETRQKGTPELNGLNRLVTQYIWRISFSLIPSVCYTYYLDRSENMSAPMIRSFECDIHSYLAHDEGTFFLSFFLSLFGERERIS